jgi:hypothetical protein
VDNDSGSFGFVNRPGLPALSRSFLLLDYLGLKLADFGMGLQVLVNPLGKIDLLNDYYVVEWPYHRGSIIAELIT